MPAALESWASSLRLSPRRGLALVAAAFAAAVVLAEVYQLVAASLSPPWLAAASVNSVGTIAVIAWRLRRGQSRLFYFGAWRWYLPALVVFCGSAGLAFASRIYGGLAKSGPSDLPWAWIVWVPIVEEVVFRAGLGQGLRRLAPQPWAAWFSAGAFALVHAEPTLGHVLVGQIGLALGPFLLGLCCEALVAASGSILPGILLHAACNATVIVFQAVDERWLVWLRVLYQ